MTQTQEEIKETTATTFLEIMVKCPYCGFHQERLDDLREHLDCGEIRATDCQAELRCENKECDKIFIVTDIKY